MGSALCKSNHTLHLWTVFRYSPVHRYWNNKATSFCCTSKTFGFKMSQTLRISALIRYCVHFSYQGTKTTNVRTYDWFCYPDVTCERFQTITSSNELVLVLNLGLPVKTDWKQQLITKALFSSQREEEGRKRTSRQVGSYISWLDPWWRHVNIKKSFIFI